ncbi:MAG: hypothetical protein RL754_1159 [Bacteroidota bacterium]|jgi:hypothetical protein
MKRIFTLFLILISVLNTKAQQLGDLDMGILASYHTLLTDRQNFVLGEEYEIGGYLLDEDHGGLIAITTSYVRNGAFQTNYFLPQNNYAIGKFTTAKIKAGRLWQLSYFDVLLSTGFGWFSGAEYSDKTGAYGLVFLDPEIPVNAFTIPFALDLQWYGFDGSVNSLGVKYELNGWGNYLGVGFTYLL